MKTEKYKEIELKSLHKANSEEKHTNVLLGAFVIFILPIAAVFFGVFLGGAIGKTAGSHIQAFQIIGGIIAFILAMVFVKLFDRSTTQSDKAEKYYWDDL